MKPSSCLACYFTLITTVEACDKDTALWDELASGGQETSSQLAPFRGHRTEKIWGSKYLVLIMGSSGREECHWLTVRVSDPSFLHSLPPPRGNSLHLSVFFFIFWCPFRTLHVLRQLEKELSHRYFSGYGQNLLALDSPYKIILTICRAALLFKDSWFFIICDSGGLGRSDK